MSDIANVTGTAEVRLLVCWGNPGREYVVGRVPFSLEKEAARSVLRESNASGGIVADDGTETLAAGAIPERWIGMATVEKSFRAEGGVILIRPEVTYG